MYAYLSTTQANRMTSRVYHLFGRHNRFFFRNFFLQIVTKLSPSLQQLSSYVFLPSALCQLKFPKRKNWADLLLLFDVLRSEKPSAPWPPHQGLWSWTPLLALHPDPRYRLVLRARYGLAPPMKISAYAPVQRTPEAVKTDVLCGREFQSTGKAPQP